LVFGLGWTVTLRKLKHVITVRLSDEDYRHYQRLLERFGQGSTRAERFRSLVNKMDFPFESRWDNEDWEFED
jgi:hypothetical protein